MMNKGDRTHKFIMFILNINKAAALRDKKKALE